MDLTKAAALLTAHAQHAYSLHQEATSALIRKAHHAFGQLGTLARKAERASELAALWDGVLWEAHGTEARTLFPLADPARLIAASRTLRTSTREKITRAYDLTFEQATDWPPEGPAQHWADRFFLLHTNIVDHMPGAHTAAAVLAELHTQLTDAPEASSALEAVNALRESRDAGPVAARDIPCRADQILIRALEGATFHGSSLNSTGGGRTAVIVPLVEGWTIRIDDGGSADHQEEDHGADRGSSGWIAYLVDPNGLDIDVIRHPSSETAYECLADSAACVRQLTQWRAENQHKGPVQN
ncbi:hypothetical protein ABZ379_45490 [Streptomyces canus]|uniref:hypothetical protein n=1 Tax=Streptomyces canus TaxID=58343 RepID=UPI0033D9F208